MTRTLRNTAASATIIAASVVGVVLAGAGTASAAEPSTGGPIYWESFSTLNLDPDAVPCTERAAANRARGDIILVNCVLRPFVFGSDTIDLIGINASLGS